MHLTHVIIYVVLTVIYMSAANNIKVTQKEINSVTVNKCCESDELVIDFQCKSAKEHNVDTWKPQFKLENGAEVKVNSYDFVHGLPNCKSGTEALIDIGNEDDGLYLLPDGRVKRILRIDFHLDADYVAAIRALHGYEVPAVEEDSYIFDHDDFCMDQLVVTTSNKTGLLAYVCV